LGTMGHNVVDNSAMTLQGLGEKKTKVEFMTKLELGDFVSRKATRKVLEKHLSIITEMTIRVANSLSMSEAIAEDGKVIGEELMLNIKRREKGRSRGDIVESLVKDNKAVRELAAKYGFIESMLKAVVTTKLTSMSQVQGCADSLSERDGTLVGQSLALSLLTTLTAQAAVDEWILQFPALQQVDNECPWFRPMLVLISYRLVGEVPWGLKLRVSLGGIMSMLDLGSDIYICALYYAQGEDRRTYFEAILASLLVSLFLQMLMSWGQNRMIGWARILQEWGFVLMGMKPAVDSYRVASGAKQEPGQPVDPMTEMTFMRMVEMFAESVPGALIQIMAILTASSEERTTIAEWGSLAITAFSVGYVSASMSYDWDTTPKLREQSPTFYGYIPAKARMRSLAFICLLLFSSGMLMIRCTSIVLLGLLGRKWAFAYIGSDLFLFLAFKVLRGDFWYWFPIDDGKIEFLMSLMNRVVINVVNNFASIVHLRSPNELGGVGWVYTVCMTMAGLPPAISVYAASGGDKIVVARARKAAIFLIPICICVLFVFFMSINRKYLRTFYSLERPKEGCISRFRNFKDEGMKARAIFMNTKHFWREIEPEVIHWVGSNWGRWEREQPKWLDDKMKGGIPKSFIPEEYRSKKPKKVRRNTSSKRSRERRPRPSHCSDDNSSSVSGVSRGEVQTPSNGRTGDDE